MSDLPTTKYCDVQDVADYLMVDISTDFQEQITEWILAIENYVEQITHRVFVAPEEEYSMFYDGNGKDSLLVDEFIKSDDFSLKIDGVEIDSSKYTLYPYNRPPFWKIILSPGVWFGNPPLFFLKTAPRGIEVSAKWCYSETCPPDISLAVAILVGGIVRSNTPNLNFVKMEMIREYKVMYDVTSEKDFVRAQDIIDKYTRVYV